jgi:hypothetical protein
VDPTIAAAFANAALVSTQEHANRVGRQSDGAAEDMRSIGAGVFRLIAQASDPSTYADYQTASHVPTPQPYVVPNFVSPPKTA